MFWFNVYEEWLYWIWVWEVCELIVLDVVDILEFIIIGFVFGLIFCVIDFLLIFMVVWCLLEVVLFFNVVLDFRLFLGVGKRVLRLFLFLIIGLGLVFVFLCVGF